MISFTALGKYKVDGTIDAQNHVTRVETKIANPVMGDTDVVATYSDYKDFSGVQFPAKILVTQGGFPLWDLTITSVTPNAPLDLPVPDAVASATASGRADDEHEAGRRRLARHRRFPSQRASWSSTSTWRSWKRRWTKRARSRFWPRPRSSSPNKPVRYVLTTHHHFDHSGGLRTYVAEGATVVTHQSNVSYFEKTLAAPATISPDAQSKAAKKPMLQGVSGKDVLTDGKQTIEVYATSGDTHTNEYTLIYLPGPRILVEGDAYSPGPPDAPVPATPPPNAVALYDEIQKLKLNVATIAPIHGRGAVPIAELRKFIGRK